MNFTSPAIVTSGQSRSSSATAAVTVGTRVEGRGGRVFRYVQNGGVALTPGNVVQAAAQITAHQNCAVPITAVNTTQVVVTPGAALGTLNQYADGLMIVSTAPDLGSAYAISGHAAFNSGTAFTLNLCADDPIQTAFTAATKVDLVANPYRGVIQAPAASTGAPVGVAVHAIQPNEYGWVQTFGPGSVLIDGTPAVGMLVSSPGTNPGAAAINSTTLAVVGVMMVTGVAGRCQAVFITIAP